MPQERNAAMRLGDDVAHLLDFGEARGGQPGTGLAAIAAAVAGTLSARVTLFCVGVALCTLITLYVAAVVHRERSCARDVQHAPPKRLVP